MIRVRDLSVSYGASEPAVDNLSLDVQAGECILVTGPSGCGKSTLARSLCGLIPHALPARMSGSVVIAGLDTLALSLPELAQHVGMVFQNPSTQLFHLRAYDEVAFGPRNLGLDEAEVASRVSWALEAVGLASFREAKPAELSGGQKQCLAIAAVLAMRPQVLVLDEPTASLDVPSTNLVMSALRFLRDRHGITIILIEHRLAEAAHLADRLLLMHDGRLVEEGKPLEILADRQRCRALGLRRPATQKPAPWTQLIQPNGHRSDPALPILELDGVSAGYGRRPVIQDIDLQLFPGDFVALVGNNGAGKSTLALVAAGLIKPLQGQVRYGGLNRPRPGLDVALLFQDPCEQLFTDSVHDEVAFGPLNYGRFDSHLHAQTLAEADLLDLTARRPFTLSVGQQQRTALAACLALRPRLLILDEPTLGQDWGHLSRLMGFLHALSRQGTAVLLISHDYKLVHHFARRAVLMDSGRITLDGTLREYQRLSDNAERMQA
ncbi:MAG TPA: ATP-binding cassette domain-containing protein [Anaerolineae bacterium]|nr:ATP-binding cassette domain-containing protein [Anaerolineae bacterium]